MDTSSTQALLSRIADLEEAFAQQSAEIAVYRGALVWLMGVHQLGFEDANPRRAVLEPLGLSLDCASVGDKDAAGVDPRLTKAARDFIEAAYGVFLSRQQPSSVT
jgi:hypothetical protein